MGAAELDIRKIQELTLYTYKRCNEPQKVELMDVLCGRVNETHHHHNLLVQFDFCNEKSIYLARKIIEKMNDGEFRLKINTEVVDFYPFPIGILFILLDGSCYIWENDDEDNNWGNYTNINSRIEWTFDLLKNSYILGRYIPNFIDVENEHYEKKLSLFLKNWNQQRIGYAAQIEKKFKEFYSVNSMLDSIIQKTRREKEINKRMLFLKNMNYRECLFLKEGDFFSKEPWISMRVYMLKEINAPERSMNYYKRYGLTNPALNRVVIDVYRDITQSVSDEWEFQNFILITKDLSFFRVEFKNDIMWKPYKSFLDDILDKIETYDSQLENLKRIKEDSDYEFYTLLGCTDLETLYGMSYDEIIAFYSKKWEGTI